MNVAVAFCDFDLFIFCFTYYIVSLLLLPCVDSRGRCQNHVYFSPHLRVKGAPSSCLSPPAAAPTACHAMAGRHTTGRCQSHWWLCLPRVSSRSSLTHDTQSRVSPPWDPRALHVRQLSTPWLSNRSLETSASIPVSQRAALIKYVKRSSPFLVEFSGYLSLRIICKLCESSCSGLQVGPTESEECAWPCLFWASAHAC